MQLIEGKKISQQLKIDIKNKIENNNIKPCLCVIRVGNDEAGKIYVQTKQKACQENGILFKELYYEFNVEEKVIIDTINQLNNDNSVDAILVQLPLPKHLNSAKIINTIKYTKDVDGLTYINRAKCNNGEPSIVPCTPKGIMYMLKYYNIKLEEKHVVIVGRSNLVGKPLLDLCLQENATVTICHSKTKNLSTFTKEADILVVAVGHKSLIKKEDIKENSIVIDVGINRIDKIIYGDVSKEAYEKTNFITPVPGGVGPMTVAMLLVNILECYQLNH